MSVVLVTGACGPAGLALGRQLAAHAVHDLVAVGADMNVRVDTPFHILVDIPPVSSASFLPALCELVEKFSVDVLIPTVSEELFLVASVAPFLFPQVKVVVTSAASAFVAGDKWLTMNALELGGVPIPLSGLGSRFISTQHAMEAFVGPVVVKPRVSRGGRNVVVYDDPRAPWPGYDDSWIVQQFAPGTEYCPQLLCTAGEGDDVVVVLEKTQLMHGNVGNAAGVARLPDDVAGDVVWLAQRTAKVLGLTGPADIDVRRLPDGQAVVLEVNSRFGAQSEAAPELLTGVLGSSVLVGT